MTRTHFSESACTRPCLSCCVFGRPVRIVVCENVCKVKNLPMSVSMSVMWCVHTQVNVDELGVISVLLSLLSTDLVPSVSYLGLPSSTVRYDGENLGRPKKEKGP